MAYIIRGRSHYKKRRKNKKLKNRKGRKEGRAEKRNFRELTTDVTRCCRSSILHGVPDSTSLLRWMQPDLHANSSCCHNTKIRQGTWKYTSSLYYVEFGVGSPGIIRFVSCFTDSFQCEIYFLPLSSSRFTFTELDPRSDCLHRIFLTTFFARV